MILFFTDPATSKRIAVVVVIVVPFSSQLIEILNEFIIIPFSSFAPITLYGSQYGSICSIHHLIVTHKYVQVCALPAQPFSTIKLGQESTQVDSNHKSTKSKVLSTLTD